MSKLIPPSGQSALLGILVVDDDSDLRLNLREVFEMHDYRVQEASNGRDAMKALSEGMLANEGQLPFNLIVTDLEMPEMGGADLIKQVRESESAHVSRIPIVVYSSSVLGHADILKQTQAQFMKPASLSLILSEVKRLLSVK
jgi:CheY-like chemotaxis protein